MSARSPPSTCQYIPLCTRTIVLPAAVAAVHSSIAISTTRPIGKLRRNSLSTNPRMVRGNKSKLDLTKLEEVSLVPGYPGVPGVPGYVPGYDVTGAWSRFAKPDSELPGHCRAELRLLLVLVRRAISNTTSISITSESGRSSRPTRRTQARDRDRPTPTPTRSQSHGPGRAGRVPAGPAAIGSGSFRA
eukprot:2277606-Rhodomonas_salina.1